MSAERKKRKLTKKVYTLWSAKFPDSWIAECWQGVPLFWLKRRDVDVMTDDPDYHDSPVKLRVTVEVLREVGR